MFSKWLKLTALALVIGLLTTSAAFAFNDLDRIPEKDAILELKSRGIVTGISEQIFHPRGQVNAQQAISLIVRGMKLNLDDVDFEQPPKASDYFVNVPDDAWYADAFVIAHWNGLPLPADIDPNAPVTREQFVAYLMSAVNAKGDYAFIEIFIDFEDKDDVSEAYMDAIQKALIAKIAELDRDGRFRPQDVITRAEAAVMVRKAIRFVEEMEPIEPLPNPDDPVSSEPDGVTFSTEPVAEGVQKVTLSWGEKPNPGYRITVSAIEFKGEDAAVIRYRLHRPEPGMMYPQVITTPTAVTYLPDAITDIRLAPSRVVDLIRPREPIGDPIRVPDREPARIPDREPNRGPNGEPIRGPIHGTDQVAE